VHGHASGFFGQFQHARICRWWESPKPIASSRHIFAKSYGLAPGLFYSDLEEMLKATQSSGRYSRTRNTYDHRRVVEICARYGVHVMMEKPLAVSLEDARAIEESVARGQDSGFGKLRNDPGIASNQAAYDLVHDNAIGEIRKIVVHDGHRGPKEIGVGPGVLAWLTDPKLNGGGALFDFGCYGADLATWLMDGRRPESVTAVTQQISADVYPRVDDEATIILTYPHAQAIVQASWNWPFSRKDMEVYGQKGLCITVGRDAVRVRLSEKEETSADSKPLEKTKEDSVSYLRAVLLGGLKTGGTIFSRNECDCDGNTRRREAVRGYGKTVSLAGTR